jgi:nucleotide-binding universal stress UspA family protein
MPGLALGPTSDEWAHEASNQAAAVLRDAGLQVAAWVERGDPRRVLINAANAWAADCIFVAARGITHLSSLHLGSIATGVAFQAPCTVEVMRAPLPARRSIPSPGSTPAPERT